ncbi:MAG: HAMP domain-containing histidine kinase, partial [Chloroflexales bacterium]|nr:HAMP domain-containing histidine kinase [Chloroflexales bacterium]
GILILGPDDGPSYANPRARQILGLADDQPLDQPFLALARQRYSRAPPEAWADWPHNDDVPRFLVCPESRTNPERWLRVDLLPPTSGDDVRVLRLRDVTTQITSQREMWTFHAMVGHKLRTPLVGILGGLNILSGGAGTMDRESITRIADVALAGARRLRAEIEDILHYLRPPADLYGVEGPTVAEVAAMAEQVAGDLGVKRLGLDYEADLAEQRLGMTRHGIEVALREVIENAVKFHPMRAPVVQVAMHPANAHSLDIGISDDGPGLQPEQLPHVWRPYYQGEHSFTGQIDGMGLGLALVARIIHAVGGHVQLTNRPDASGALVILSVPLAV